MLEINLYLFYAIRFSVMNGNFPMLFAVCYLKPFSLEICCFCFLINLWIWIANCIVKSLVILVCLSPNSGLLFASSANSTENDCKLTC